MLEEATKIIKALQDRGHIAVFAGGCVRDHFLGKTPKDIDVATSATPDEVEALFNHTIPVGKQFGVIVVVENEMEFEVATLRTESSSSDGRRPDVVEFVGKQHSIANTLLVDAKRRDFTMNAMFFDPITETLFDFFGGEFDIEDRTIACVGEPSERFEEDKLRMLRAVRFASQLGFKIEDFTMSGITLNSKDISEVSNERIKAELDKILLSENPVEGIELLKFSGLLHEVLPEVAVLSAVEQSKKWHFEGDAFKHTMMGLREARQQSTDLDVLWGILLHDIGKALCGEEVDGIIKHREHARIGEKMADCVMRRFKASNDHRIAVTATVGSHMRIKQADKMKVSTLRRMMSEEHFEKIMLVSICDSMNAIPENHMDGINKFDWVRRIEDVKIENLNKKELPKCLIGGKDLINLGLTPSKEFSGILNMVMDKQLEGEITTAEEAIEFVKERIG